MAEEMQKLERLKAAREVLRCSLEKSKELAFRVDESGARLERMSQRLALLETTMNAISTKWKLYKIKGPLHQAFGLSASIVDMFEVICGLEIAISADLSSSGLFAYLNNVKYTEDALRFLNGNCKLVIPWLEDAQQILESNKSIADHWYLKNVKKCLVALEELQAMEERFKLRGGALGSALDKLESEFARLLLDNRSHPPLPLPLPQPVLEKVQAIVERLGANDHLENCISVYVEVRSSNVRETLQALDLDYLEISLTELDSLQSLEDCIDQWGRHLEFAVKYVLEVEHRLCFEVFRKVGSDTTWMDCFAKIAVQSGIQNFFKFGNSVARSKKEAIKLLKLLDIFAALNKLRSDFNTLFKGESCAEIKNQTRDLIKKVVDGACEIFWELSLQVEVQIPSNPPRDCGVPRLVTFVTDFCNQLLENEHWQTLLQVAEIHQGWNHKLFDENLLSGEIHNIVISLERNLETWAGEYKDTPSSCLFMINTNWYLCKATRGTKLADIMGQEWLRGHEEYLEYYEAVYLKESWGRLPALLCNEEMAFDPQAATRALTEFTAAFDSMCQRQSNVVLCDKGLRWRTCDLVLRAVVPPYKSYLESYVSSIEHKTGCRIDVKYTPESLQIMVSSLFQPKFGKLGNTKCTELINKVNNVIANPFSSTPAAA
ncbi:PREDICTED: exocyst complex component EXO70A1-like [Ipomoea nil]|uniref:exocyst complex component EXO70A1-like n=1 Tax=Ipomoea nil TaxID=35883 RepID=UPI000900C178|nr:PREDICTED: exocyst complex component EXO70A1-like [Ipomoea nil]